MSSKVSLAADELIDVSRIPTKVTTLADLYTFLIEQRDLIAITPKADNESSGRLRQYKFYIASIYAINLYVNTEACARNITYNAHAESVMAVGSAIPPPGLGVKATTLWKKTMDPTNRRAVMVIISILRLATPEMRIQEIMVEGMSTLKMLRDALADEKDDWERVAEMGGGERGARAAGGRGGGGRSGAAMQGGGFGVEGARFFVADDRDAISPHNTIMGGIEEHRAGFQSQGADGDEGGPPDLEEG